MAYGSAMRVMVTILWFLTAFVAGASLYAISRPNPVVQALVMQLKGHGLMERCRQAGACGKPAAPDQRPIPALPSDLDRA
ncbi:MAG: hypothetical protein H0U98_17785 [Alphaproteobacteria bacterium]|nr:hypothetical protein [Alphaproteobacteria bacterium]